jgi:hypothetical protein
MKHSEMISCWKGVSMEDEYSLSIVFALIGEKLWKRECNVLFAFARL